MAGQLVQAPDTAEPAEAPRAAPVAVEDPGAELALAVGQDDPWRRELTTSPA